MKSQILTNTATAADAVSRTSTCESCIYVHREGEAERMGECVCVCVRVYVCMCVCVFVCVFVCFNAVPHDAAHNA